MLEIVFLSSKLSHANTFTLYAFGIIFEYAFILDISFESNISSEII